MHGLGTRFQIKVVGGTRDGELIYESTDWEHPQMLTLATPLVLADEDAHQRPRVGLLTRPSRPSAVSEFLTVLSERAASSAVWIFGR